MRVFILAYQYLDLEKSIIDEFKKQGHDVFVIYDKELHTDCYKRKGKKGMVVNFIYNIYNKLSHKYEHYWKQQIRSHKELDQPFDLFFCIQGVSFDKCLLKHLRSLNADIKSSLYIWDTNKYYNYFRNAKYFDKVATFDYDDSVQFHVSFLPFYWIETNNSNEVKYDVSIIGSDHDGRFEIINKLYPLLNDNNITNFIRIKIDNSPYFYLPRWKIKMYKVFQPNKLVEIKEMWNLKKMAPFSTFDYMPINEVNEMIAQTNCIIDTDRETQSGTTPRIIWALALGKKVMSTNVNLKKMPFYDERQIMIFDRNNPVIDVDFIKSRVEVFKVNKYINELRIDKWIKNFIL